MNAGPDVERVIADWLVEEAPARAPDRILDSVAHVIDRTRQRRFAVAWREPMTLSIGRLVAALAIVVLVVGGGALWLGRSTADNGRPSGTQAPPSPSPSPSTLSPSGPTLESYRAARDAICSPLNAQLIALNEQAGKLHPETSAADLQASISNLQQIVAIGDHEIASLAGLAAPEALQQEHATDVTHHRDSLAVLKEALAKLQAGKVVEANAIGDTTNPLSGLEEAYEAKYTLAGCP